MTTDLTILLPALNESRAIGTLIDEIRDEVRIAHVLLVADSNSTDSTASIAATKGCTVVTSPARGKGNAVRTAVSQITTPYVIMLNSDLTYPPEHIETIYRRLVKGADVVIGVRALVHTGAMTFLHSVGNWCLSKLASVLYGVPITDLCTGMWGFRASALKSFNLTSTHFTLEADFYINTVKGKYLLQQIPIGYRCRVDGDRPKLRLSDGFKIGKFLLWNRYGKY